MVKSLLKQLLYFLYIIVVVFVLLEVVLRFYNPIPVRLKGDEIVLPINQKILLKNDFPNFDKQIVHTKNSLGFRGPEMPDNYAEAVSIIAVGGSTTECYFVSDDKVWTRVAADSLQKTIPNIWINNAGLNGHSTFGHLILMKDHIVKLKPKFVLFLTGVNDIEREDLGSFDKTMLKDEGTNAEGTSFKDILKTIVKKSEVLNLIYNFSKALDAKNKNIFIDKVLKLDVKDTVTLSQTYIDKELQLQDKFVEAYRSRISSLHKICVENGIEPIFITQPYLFGEGKDPKTGTDLAKYRMYGDKNGKLVWDKLQKYNNAVRDYCGENGIYLIDMANELPKSTRYFYDEMHYSNDGSIKFGQIVADHLKTHLIKKER